MTASHSDPRLTERRNPRTADIDLATPREIVDLLNAEDRFVLDAVATQRDAIARAIELAEQAFRAGGRLFYVAPAPRAVSVCSTRANARPPSARDPEMVQGIIAGGFPALTQSQEGAEDVAPMAQTRWTAHRRERARLRRRHCRVGNHALRTRRARARGSARRAHRDPRLLAARRDVLDLVDVAIIPITGPEPVTGSTRMKAGTATKLVLNMITTGAMIRIGKTFGNLMVDLRAMSAKLVDRGERIVMEVTGVERDGGSRADRWRGRKREDGDRDAAARPLARPGGARAARCRRRRAPGASTRAPAGRVSDARAGGGTRRMCSWGSCPAPLQTAFPPPPCASRCECGIAQRELLAYHEQPYAAAQRDRLLCALDGASLADLARLDFELGAWLADAALAVIGAAGLVPRDVRAVASHGHTIWHEAPHATWQIGQSAVIAERTGVDVISDFRVRDVAAGGQGAPLVAIADRLLFGADGAWRALQNIGGIGNVSVVPPRGVDAPVVAFDTGPGVAIIDGVVRSLSPALGYDVDGALARRGTAIDERRCGFAGRAVLRVGAAQVHGARAVQPRLHCALHRALPGGEPARNH